MRQTVNNNSSTDALNRRYLEHAIHDRNRAKLISLRDTSDDKELANAINLYLENDDFAYYVDHNGLENPSIDLYDSLYDASELDIIYYYEKRYGSKQETEVDPYFKGFMLIIGVVFVIPFLLFLSDLI